jgi:hypothetical protein
MAGWANPGDRIAIDLDLGVERAVEQAEVTFMRSDISGVELPAGILVSGSLDGASLTPLGRSSWTPAVPLAREPLRDILHPAEHHGNKVDLGLGLDPDFWSGVFDPEAAADRNIDLMLRLEELYGDSPRSPGGTCRRESTTATPCAPTSTRPPWPTLGASPTPPTSAPGGRGWSDPTSA